MVCAGVIECEGVGGMFQPGVVIKCEVVVNRGSVRLGNISIFRGGPAAIWPCETANSEQRTPFPPPGRRPRRRGGLC